MRDEISISRLLSKDFLVTFSVGILLFAFVSTAAPIFPAKVLLGQDPFRNVKSAYSTFDSAEISQEEIQHRQLNFESVCDQFKMRAWFGAILYILAGLLLVIRIKRGPPNGFVIVLLILWLTAMVVAIAGKDTAFPYGHYGR